MVLVVVGNKAGPSAVSHSEKQQKERNRNNIRSSIMEVRYILLCRVLCVLLSVITWFYWWSVQRQVLKAGCLICVFLVTQQQGGPPCIRVGLNSMLSTRKIAYSVFWQGSWGLQ
jgi:hypothetical protein